MSDSISQVIGTFSEVVAILMKAALLTPMTMLLALIAAAYVDIALVMQTVSQLTDSRAELAQPIVQQWIGLSFIFALAAAAVSTTSFRMVRAGTAMRMCGPIMEARPGNAP